MPFQVLTAVGRGFENTWSTEIDGVSYPTYFDNRAEAGVALDEHLNDEKDAKRDGHLETRSRRGDFKIEFISIHAIKLAPL